MRLQIKTLSQKSLMVDIDDTKTVLELKRELSQYPDVGVRPALQKLIYAGQVLSNEDSLSTYNIDVKKFLVVMVLKQPLQEEEVVDDKTASPTATATVTATEDTPIASTSFATPTKKEPSKEEECGGSTSDTEFKTPPAPAPTPAQSPAARSRKSENEQMVESIVNMGYPETEVRRALIASFYSPERAIEYLVEGIPESSTAQDGNVYEMDEELTMSPFEMFRSDPLLRHLRTAIQQHPDLIDEAIQRVGEANPAILSMINENQQEFLSMLMEGSDEEDDDDDSS